MNDPLKEEDNQRRSSWKWVLFNFLLLVAILVLTPFWIKAGGDAPLVAVLFTDLIGILTLICFFRCPPRFKIQKGLG